MLKLNARDLVKRAQQLADLENSSFISWNENVQLLNEAFQKVYQKMINHDDKTYLKTSTLINAGGGNKAIYDLPDDFYQLYALNDANSNRCIVRNSINDPINTVGYSIENNQIVINGYHGQAIEMRYYPIPPTITLKAENVDITLPSDYDLTENRSDTFDHYIAFLKAGNNVLSVKNFITDEIVFNLPVASISAVTKVIAGKNGVIIFRDPAEWKFYSYHGSDKSGYYGVALDIDKNIWVFDYNTKSLVLYDEYGSEIESIDLSNKVYNPMTTPDANVGYVDGHNYYYVTNNNKLYVYDMDTDEEVYLKDLNANSTNFVSYIFNGMYITKSKVLYTLSNEKVDVSVIGINKLDFDTGYGYTTKSGKVKGIFTDTEIDYPNNLFVQFLSYQLAIQYKAKQNVDAAGLLALYQEAENQFYDTIGRDDFGYTRIQNVY